MLARGGRGGQGCVSHHHEPFTRHKAADGSDGGAGARVVIVAQKDVTTLNGAPATAAGKQGAHGQGKMKTGARAKDHVVHVPTGTTVTMDGVQVADLTEHGEAYVAAEGGAPGRGNTGGLPETRARDFSDDIRMGDEGEEVWVENGKLIK